MYSKPFYIDKDIGNNSLSFFERQKATGRESKLYVPSLKKIQDFSEIKLLSPFHKGSTSQDRGIINKKITFEDFWFDDKLSTNYWLENFYEIPWNSKKIYLFDNHNHALYFWYLAKHNWVIRDNSLLYHVDEHADYREADVEIEKTDLESIFNYTNFSKINVWNYIIPAEKEGLIWETVQIRSEKELEEYVSKIGQTQGTAPTDICRGESCVHPSIILNLDLDFFQPDLDFIDYEMKKKVVLDIAAKADVITVATSPFFIDQKLALEVFEDLFYKQ